MVTPDTIDRALRGELPALDELVRAARPVIQAQVARSLARRRGASLQRDTHQYVDDLTQDVFVALFDASGRVLRQWDPERGLDFAGFLRLLAEHEVASRLRSRVQSPWTETPTDDEILGQDADPAAGPEAEVITREALRAIHDRLRAHLSERGLELFEMLLVEGHTTEEVCALTRLKPDAVYAWRSRIGRLAGTIAREYRDRAPGARRLPRPPLPSKDAPAARPPTPERHDRVMAPAPRRRSPIDRRAEQTLREARDASARAQAALAKARALRAWTTRLQEELEAAFVIATSLHRRPPPARAARY
jgi:RNA polymerase sigma-70 factor (ECF subfamily)